ncbi:hypothetical protein L4C36_09300 [Photobacterium japonica]|uniref:hypothetical protein n=1 Tax=Photobacterium japonica TaxID=2910235 RepID=UPI003D0CF1B5
MRTFYHPLFTCLFIINLVALSPHAMADMVTLCHKPGTPAEKTLTVNSNALSGHLGHGDSLGACGAGEESGAATEITEPASVYLFLLGLFLIACRFAHTLRQRVCAFTGRAIRRL